MVGSHSSLIILTDKIVNFSEVTSAHKYNNNNNNNNNNNLFNLSSFTVSQANYRLTRGCHGIASSFFFIYNYISSTLPNHLFFNHI
jgi:hypothetical protein